MTDETKNLFDAPWHIENYCQTVFSLLDSSGCYIATQVVCEADAKRLSHFPELYDALMYLVVNYCHEAFLSCDECRLCPDQNCKGRKWVELLRKVRNGE